MIEKLPYSKTNDYTSEQADARRRVVAKHTQVNFQHTNQYSFNPKVLAGNIENFSGVVQVPMGFAGPILINGLFL